MEKKNRLGIGALSRACGIPAHTIRTWERRYGFPHAERTAGGHRLYQSSTAHHLRLVKRVLELGHRPATTLGMSLQDLQNLLEPTSIHHTSSAQHMPPPNIDVPVGQWLEVLNPPNPARFDHLLQRSHALLGTLNFLESAIVPFLTLLGEAWINKEISDAQEHFITSHVKYFLEQQWRPRAMLSQGPLVVLASLPGERHTLGLHMVAWCLALRDWQPIFVGANCPQESLIKFTQTMPTAAICLSIASSADRSVVSMNLQELTQTIPQVTIMTGGSGSFPYPETLHFSTLGALDRWILSQQL